MSFKNKEALTFVTDVDGTTLMPGEIFFKDQTKEAFKYLLKENNLIVASGRTYRQLRKLYGDFLSEEEVNNLVFIAENGNVAYKNNALLYVHYFEDDFVKNVIKDLLNVEECAVLVSLVDKALYYENGEIYIDEDEIPFKKGVSKEEFYELILKEKPIKISAYFPDYDNDKTPFINTHKYLIDTYSDLYRVDFFDANNKWIDCSSKFTNKGTTLKLVVDKFNLNPDNIHVFGDGENDLAMFEVTSKTHSPITALKITKDKASSIYNEFSEEIHKILD